MLIDFLGEPLKVISGDVIRSASRGHIVGSQLEIIPSN